MTANLNVLDRDLARQKVMAAAGRTTEILRDVVDEGTFLLARVEQTVCARWTPRPAHVGLVLMLRHVLSLADAVDELVRAGCMQPAILPMRSIVEARMQLLYLLGERSPYAANPLPADEVNAVPRDAAGAALSGAELEEVQDRRGRAYWVAELRRQRDTALRLDPQVAAERLERLLDTPVVLSDLQDPAVQAEVAASLDRLDALLGEPGTAEVDSEFQRARGKRDFDPVWYSLWRGPRNVRQLARSVGMAFQYEWFYSRASRTMHGTDVLGQLGPERLGGGRSVAPLRGAEGLDDVATAFVTQMASLYRTAVLAVRPEEEPLTRTWLRRWSPGREGDAPTAR